MLKAILDTSAYAAFMRGHKELRNALQQTREIYLNSIVLGELLAGFKKGNWARKNIKELQLFLESTRVNILDLNLDTAERYAVILNTLWKAGTPIPTNDIWIAASAMQYGLSILTTDAHYLKIPQVLVEFFKTQ